MTLILRRLLFCLLSIPATLIMGAWGGLLLISAGIRWIAGRNDADDFLTRHGDWEDTWAEWLKRLGRFE
jgi:hypothetical protein